MLKLPDAWKDWPLAVEVQFHLTEANSISADDYKTFAAATLDDGARKLFEVESNGWCFPGYRLHGNGVVPALSCWVVWPLARKSAEPTVRERVGPRTDATGLSFGSEDTVLYLWKEPLGKYVCRGQFRLAVGGRSVAEAIAAYDLIAPQLRRLLREVRSKKTA